MAGVLWCRPRMSIFRWTRTAALAAVFLGMSTPAFAYLRVSSTGQVDGHGYERQGDAVQAFAASNGFAVQKTFRDAHTGTEADRPEFAAMIAACKAGGVRTVLIERLDRFVRGIGMQLALLGVLQREGIALIEASTGRDVTAAQQDDDPMARAMISMQGVFHQVEKELLVLKLRAARNAKKAKTGRCEGSYPFGHAHYPEEAEALATLLALHRKPRGKPRRSTQAIATELQRMGIPTRTGKPWSRASVHSILARQ